MAGPLRVSGEINKPFPDLRGRGDTRGTGKTPVDIQKASLCLPAGTGRGWVLKLKLRRTGSRRGLGVGCVVMA